MEENNRVFEVENTEELNTESVPDELSYGDASFDEASQEVVVEEKKKKSWQKELYEWVSSIAVAVVLALLINTFFFSLVQVDGQSMVPTLQHGERLIVRKIAYTPEYGDVVIVKSEALQKYIVKRAIALPGQEIGFDSELNVTVDGKTLREEYIAEKQFTTGGLYNYPLTVPKKGEIASIEVLLIEMSKLPDKVNIEEKDGKIMVSGSSFVADGEFKAGETRYTQDGYFVLGDNRNNSLDSRGLGFVPKGEIVGEAVLRFLPLSEFGLIN